MFRIREDQIRELSEVTRAQFRERLRVMLRETLPSVTQDFDDDRLGEIVVNAEGRAHGLGIESQRGVAQFVMLDVCSTQHLDEQPEVNHFLTQSRLAPDTGIQVLFDALLEKLQPDASE